MAAGASSLCPTWQRLVLLLLGAEVEGEEEHSTRHNEILQGEVCFLQPWGIPSASLSISTDAGGAIARREDAVVAAA